VDGKAFLIQLNCRDNVMVSVINHLACCAAHGETKFAILGERARDTRKILNPT
jgi:hypothetical protein